jgi:hypothetical protein
MSEIHQEAERVTSGVQVIVDLSAMLRGQLETLLVNRFQEPAAHFLVYLEASPDDAVAFLFINDLGHPTSSLCLNFGVVSRSPRIESMGSNHETHETHEKTEPKKRVTLRLASAKGDATRSPVPQ